MRSFRFQIMVWIALAVVLVGLLMFSLAASYVVKTEADNSKDFLKSVAFGTIRMLPRDPGKISADHLIAIDEALTFADRKKRLRMAIYADDLRLFATRMPPQLTDLAPPDPGDQYNFTWWPEGLEYWTYSFRLEQPPYTIILRSTGHEETFEQLLTVLGIYLVLMIPVGILSGRALSRKIVAPLHRIAETAEQVSMGNLKARIRDEGLPHAELRQLVNTLNDTFSQLDKLFTQQAEFSNHAAHELRTPLTALRGSLEVCLRRERPNEEYQDTLAESIQAISQLQQIVETLLLLSRPGSQVREQFASVELAAVVENIVEQLEPIAEMKNITLQVALGNAPPIMGGKTLLGRLIYNLVHNAIRHNPPGTLIEIILSLQEDQVVVTVRDHGTGISPEHLPHLFERFYQIDSSRAQGTGLGLSLASWIANVHAGNIEVTSEVGKGTSFQVTLPTGGSEPIV